MIDLNADICTLKPEEPRFSKRGPLGFSLALSASSGIKVKVVFLVL